MNYPKDIKQAKSLNSFKILLDIKKQFECYLRNKLIFRMDTVINDEIVKELANKIEL